MDVKRGLDNAVEHVIEKIKSSSKKVKTNDEIAQVGTISANGEKEIGDMISKAMQKEDAGARTLPPGTHRDQSKRSSRSR